jgi:hypothetical protein
MLKEIVLTLHLLALSSRPLPSEWNLLDFAAHSHLSQTPESGIGLPCQEVLVCRVYRIFTIVLLLLLTCQTLMAIHWLRALSWSDTEPSPVSTPVSEAKGDCIAIGGHCHAQTAMQEKHRSSFPAHHSHHSRAFPVSKVSEASGDCTALRGADVLAKPPGEASFVPEPTPVS